MTKFSVKALAGALLALSSLQPMASFAGDTSQLLLEAGGTNIFRSGLTNAGAQVEYRSAARFSFLQPMGGVMGDDKGAAYAYAGVYHDFNLGQKWILSASTSLGAYRAGDSRQLGGPAEFQSGLNLMYKLPRDSQVGVSLRHLSNAHLYSHNPGTETFMAVYAMPLGK